jgi:hypothetical protein
MWISVPFPRVALALFAAGALAVMGCGGGHRVGGSGGTSGAGGSGSGGSGVGGTSGTSGTGGTTGGTGGGGAGGLGPCIIGSSHVGNCIL